MTYLVLVPDAIAREGVELLSGSPGLTVDYRPGLAREHLVEIIHRYDALIVRSGTRVDAPLLDEANKLRVIGRAGAGTDNIDLRRATERGVAVLNAPAGNIYSAAEYTLGLMLALARRIPLAAASVRGGRWEAFRGSELRGKTLGLVGVGRVGAQVARTALGLGMRVLAADPYLSHARAEEIGVDVVRLRECLRRADFVSMHVPLTPETRSLIGAVELAMMKPTAVLINISHGGVIDEDALASALRARQLGGAALDAFSIEPLPSNSPLRDLDNAILTPRLAGATEDALQHVAIEICGAVRDALIRGDYSTAVNGPYMGAGEAGRLGPALTLAGKLGRVAGALWGRAIHEVELRYNSTEDRELRALAVTALCELLQQATDTPVNIVNAMHVAAGLGIRTARVAAPPTEGLASIVELVLRGAAGEHRLAGTILADGKPRLVRIDDYRVDVVPSGTLLLVRNRDVPGGIGRIGTLLGESGVNISGYHQTRAERDGEALAVLTVDQRVPDALVERLGALPEVTEVRQVAL